MWAHSYSRIPVEQPKVVTFRHAEHPKLYSLELVIPYDDDDDANMQIRLLI